MKIEKPNYKIIQEVEDRLSSEFNEKLEDYFIDGLKKRGFEFKEKIELEEFIKKRCRYEDNVDLKEKIYYVDNVPFFLHNYKDKELHIGGVVRSADVNILDSDITTIEALHDLLLDAHGYSLDFKLLEKARELTTKMYKALY